MRLKLRIGGFPEAILNEIVAKGIASNKAEAVHLVLLHYNEHFGIKEVKPFSAAPEKESKHL